MKQVVYIHAYIHTLMKIVHNITLVHAGCDVDGSTRKQWTQCGGPAVYEPREATGTSTIHT